jgi:Zn-dependent metalloprotease
MTSTIRLSVAFLLFSVVAMAQNMQSALDSFTAQTGAVSTIDKATGSVNFIKFPATRSLKQNGSTVQDKALGFMGQNSNLFGSEQSGLNNYRTKDSRQDLFGMEHVALQQYVSDVPVFDGIIKFHYNKNKELTSLNGNHIRVNKLNTTPSVTIEEAERLALAIVTDQKAGPGKGNLKAPLKIFKTTLYIFQKGLAQGYQGAIHLVYEVEVRNDADIREFLYIDAHTLNLVEQFTGMHGALDRELYTYPPGSNTSTTPALTWKEGDPFPGSLSIWQKSELEAAGHTYHFMKNAFGRDSYNNAGASMITTHNNPGINCPNANWNGVSANYCDNIASDDVVAHEWAHAYTEYTSGLIYAWQPGALNEAYSDIWGETIDLINNYFDDDEGVALRSPDGTDHPAISLTARWKMGEKASAYGTPDGSIRDMYNPNAKGHAGRVLDPLYHCGINDNGGVHQNSGVINHSYALLVDGGTYNGQTISGIGLTKAAHIYWYAQANFMTKTTDFAAHADMLVASAQTLMDAQLNLPLLSVVEGESGQSGQFITVDDIIELEKVLLAVEMRTEVNCGFQPILQPVSALCEGASSSNAIFSEDFESGLGSFSTSFTTGSGSWVNREWVQTSAPGGRPGKVAFGVDFEGGDCSTSNQRGVIRLESPDINIPAGTAGNLNLVFDHYVALEEGWDGANIKYSLNGGETWTLLPRKAFTANPYNNVIIGSELGNDNPLAGQMAFSGVNLGLVRGGSWGQSQVDLSFLGLAAGGKIKLRWEVGTDCGYGIDGWYIDDVKVYTCAITPAVHFVGSGGTVNEGEATVESGCLKYVEKGIKVQIDKAPTQPVEVNLVVAGGTARQGSTADFTISPSTVVLNADNLMQEFIVRVYNDAYVEGEETINLEYTLNTNSGDGYAASDFQTYTLTIVDDDLTPGKYTEELFVSKFNTWGNWRVRNGGNYVNTWDLASYNNAGLDGFGDSFLFSNGISGASPTRDEVMESPEFNTAGKKNLVLQFSQDWNPTSGGIADQGIVSVWDGTTWQTLLTQTEGARKGNILSNTADIQRINIPEAYANVGMKIRFQYIASNSGWWGIDNVIVSSSNSTDILTTVNSGVGAQQYLGPHETAVFYDPSSGYLMAKIKNLTSHDYGCTTVEIDRIGVDTRPWLMSYNITNKTFKVTPTNNNPAGQYEITLYYKASELETFNGGMVKSMGKSAGGIGTGNVGNTSYAEVQVRSAFNTDHAYTATFDSGFSGFGLSDAPPVGSLPVRLVKFEGAHGVEGNLLKWETTSEENNEYFAVERASDAKQFAEIGRVSGNGNSMITNRYNFTDTRFSKGLNYYRLKQVDHDGSRAYSKVVAINALHSRELKYFPNPVQAILNIELPDVSLSQVSFKIINISGQVVMKKDIVKTTNGSLMQDVSQLGTGLYQVVVSDGTSNYSFSVMKM